MATPATENEALHLITQGRCPTCRKPGLIPGASGGVSQNFYCEACGDGWNAHGLAYGGISVDFLGPINPALIAKYKSGALP